MTRKQPSSPVLLVRCPDGTEVLILSERPSEPPPAPARPRLVVVTTGVEVAPSSRRAA